MNTQSPPQAATPISDFHADFIVWLNTKDRRPSFEYHRGFLAVDVCKSASTLREDDRRTLGAMARDAAKASDAGFIHLTQRRHGEGDYSYLATRCASPKKRAR